MTLVDNNVLSALAKVERLDVLRAVFDEIETSAAVVAELERARAAGYEFVDRVDAVKSYNGGWMDVYSATEDELEFADDIRDHALSSTDARCIAIAARRGRRLVSDDGHVGTVGREHDVPVWDLPVVLQAAVRRDVVATAAECSELLAALRRYDDYHLASEDEAALFEEF